MNREVATNLARLVVAGHVLVNQTDSGQILEPMVTELEAAFDEWEGGRFMPLRTFFGPGDAAPIVERFILDALSEDYEPSEAELIRYYHSGGGEDPVSAQQIRDAGRPGL